MYEAQTVLAKGGGSDMQPASCLTGIVFLGSEFYVRCRLQVFYQTASSQHETMCPCANSNLRPSVSLRLTEKYVTHSVGERE